MTLLLETQITIQMKFEIGQVVNWQNKSGVIYEIVNEKKKLYKVLFSYNNQFSATPIMFVIEENKLTAKETNE
jgi:hypothetical protein